MRRAEGRPFQAEGNSKCKGFLRQEHTWHFEGHKGRKIAGVDEQRRVLRDETEIRKDGGCGNQTIFLSVLGSHQRVLRCGSSDFT